MQGTGSLLGWSYIVLPFSMPFFQTYPLLPVDGYKRLCEKEIRDLEQIGILWWIENSVNRGAFLDDNYLQA